MRIFRFLLKADSKSESSNDFLEEINSEIVKTPHQLLNENTRWQKLFHEKRDEVIAAFVKYEHNFVGFDLLLEEAAQIIVKKNLGLAVVLTIPLKIGPNRATLIFSQLELIGIIKSNPGRLSNILINTEIELHHLFQDQSYKTAFIDFYNEYIIEIRQKIQEQRSIKMQILIEQEKETIKKDILERERKNQLQKEAYQELVNQGILKQTINEYPRREPIPQDVMNQVWNRDGGRCTKCGSQENLEFDHIIPFSKGGSNTYRNLQLLCSKCNIEKSNKIG